MDLYQVYSLFNVTPERAEGNYLWDKNGVQYLDLYGGHAVISIGHSHPHYIRRITDQLKKIGFYSNSVQNPLQVELSRKLGDLSGYDAYHLFLCNSGAEANENALKLASFATGRDKVIAFSQAFHGRTSGAVAITDNPKIVSPFNAHHKVEFVPFNDIESADKAIDEQVAAVIVEGIQGVAGIRVAGNEFLQFLRKKCDETGSLLILDEVQSGCGRSGNYFSHQYAGIKADLVTMAKGLGNGFPVAGVMIHPDIKPWAGQLGTTFGGNYLACVAALAVVEVLEEENLIKNAEEIGAYLLQELNQIEQIREVRGRGLMIGFDISESDAGLRKELLYEHHIFTGASGATTIRLLPALTLNREECDAFLGALKGIFASYAK